MMETPEKVGAAAAAAVEEKLRGGSVMGMEILMDLEEGLERGLESPNSLNNSGGGRGGDGDDNNNAKRRVSTKVLLDGLMRRVSGAIVHATEQEELSTRSSSSGYEISSILDCPLAIDGVGNSRHSVYEDDEDGENVQQQQQQQAQQPQSSIAEEGPLEVSSSGAEGGRGQQEREGGALPPPSEPLPPQQQRQQQQQPARQGASGKRRKSTTKTKVVAGARSFFRDLHGVNEVRDYSKYEHGLRFIINQKLDRPICNTLSMVATLIALFLLDTTEAALASEAVFVVIYALIFASLVWFTVEMIVRCYAQEGYSTSLFFVLDLLGTLSLVPDIPWLWPKSWAITGLAAARAARTARIVRLFRILRMVRLVKLLRVVGNINQERDRRTEREWATGGDTERESNDPTAAARKTAPQSKAQQGPRTQGFGDLELELSRKHAETVERRVVLGVLLVMVALPLLEVANDDFEIGALLSLMQDGITQSYLPQSAVNETADFIIAEYDSIVHIAAGTFLYENTAGTNSRTVIDVGQELGYDWPDVVVKMDMSDVVVESSLYSIALTVIIALVFSVGAYVFNNDARKIILAPVERLTNLTSKLAGTMFAVNTDEIKGREIDFIHGVLLKMSKFFIVKKHKVTTVYSADANDGTVWKTTAIANNTPGSSNDETELKERLLFTGFLADPQAIRYFRKYVDREQNCVSLLHFWEEIERFRNDMLGTNKIAQVVWKRFLDKDAPKPLRIHDQPANVFKGEEQTQIDMHTEIMLGQPSSSLFDDVQDQAALTMLGPFEKFLTSDIFESLVRAKEGQSRAVLVQRELNDDI